MNIKMLTIRTGYNFKLQDAYNQLLYMNLIGLIFLAR